MTAPAPTRGVPVELDRTRYIRYSIKTVRDLCEHFAVAAIEDVALDQNTLGQFLWFGLKHEDPDLTPEAVEEMVDLEHLVTIQGRVAQALGGSPASIAEAIRALGEAEADDDVPDVSVASDAEVAADPPTIEPAEPEAALRRVGGG